MAERHQKQGQGHALGLTRDKIVAAGLDMVDRAGIEGLKMRALAAEIGCDPMAIYHFVPNKAALLDAITEHIEREAAPPRGNVDDWRSALHEFADNQLAVGMKHPNAIPLYTLRVSANPATQQIHGWLSGLFTTLRLSDTAGAVQLCIAGINGVLLNYSALRGNAPDAERVAQETMHAMVEAICARCEAEIP